MTISILLILIGEAFSAGDPYTPSINKLYLHALGRGAQPAEAQVLAAALVSRGGDEQARACVTLALLESPEARSFRGQGWRRRLFGEGTKGPALSGEGANFFSWLAEIVAGDRFFDKVAGRDPQKLVGLLFEKLMGRRPAPAELSHWVAKLGKGRTPARKAAIVQLLAEPDVRQAFVRTWYEEYLGNRSPNPSEVEMWASRLKDSDDYQGTLAWFLASPEYFSGAPRAAVPIPGPYACGGDWALASKEMTSTRPSAVGTLYPLGRDPDALRRLKGSDLALIPIGVDKAGESESEIQLRRLVAERSLLMAQGLSLPLLSPHLDTPTLESMKDADGKPADFGSEVVKKGLYRKVRDFFSIVPRSHRLHIQGRPVVVLGRLSELKGINVRFLPDFRGQFLLELDVDPFIVKAEDDVSHKLKLKPEWLRSWAVRLNAGGSPAGEIRGFIADLRLSQRKMNDDEFLELVFASFLERSPAEPEISKWKNELRKLSRKQLAVMFGDAPLSIEHYLGKFIAELFEGAKSVPETISRQIPVWQKKMANGVYIGEIFSELLGGEDFYRVSGGTPKLFVDELFGKLLRRCPRSEEASHYIHLLGPVGRSRRDVVTAIMVQTEFLGELFGRWYADVAATKVGKADYEYVGGPPECVGYRSFVFANPERDTKFFDRLSTKSLRPKFLVLENSGKSLSAFMKRIRD